MRHCFKNTNPLFFFGLLLLTLVVVGCSFTDDNIPNAVRPEFKKFISIWKTDNLSSLSTGSTTSSNYAPSGDTQIKLPLIKEGTYNFTVDWGDGTTDKITKWDDTKTRHTYDASGQYTVIIEGIIKGWSFNKDASVSPLISFSDAAKLIEIKAWGGLIFGKNAAAKGAFAGTENLKITATDTPNLSETVTLAYCFLRSGIESIPNINAWDLSKVKNLWGMFAVTANFNQNLNAWKLPEVTNTTFMFFDTKAFNGDISAWKLPKATKTTNMFTKALVFNQDISQWEFPEATDMKSMFSRTGAFNQDISNWAFPKCPDISNMFLGSKAFDQDLSTWDVLCMASHKGMFDNSKMAGKTAQYPQNYNDN